MPEQPLCPRCHSANVGVVRTLGTPLEPVLQLRVRADVMHALGESLEHFLRGSTVVRPFLSGWNCLTLLTCATVCLEPASLGWCSAMSSTGQYSWLVRLSSMHYQASLDLTVSE